MEKYGAEEEEDVDSNIWTKSTPELKRHLYNNAELSRLMEGKEKRGSRKGYKEEWRI